MGGYCTGFLGICGGNGIVYGETDKVIDEFKDTNI
jgi:hypothetical protein